MDNNENKKNILLTEPNKQIQLVVNRPETNDTTIDLGNVFHNMKLKSRVFAWLLILLLVIGISSPLLLYQFNRPMLKVSSVVTLRYEAPVKVLEEKKDGSEEKEWVIPDDPEYAPVSDLSAPDGSNLDLNQITSSYVLQTALNRVSLSKPISAGSLRSNIDIQTILTEESQRTKESLAGLAAAKNAEAYKQLQDAEMKYQNRFVVSLINGFKEGEESKTVIELTDAELKQLLDMVLTVYNEYLVMAYADTKLPEDTFSMIDVTAQDVSDSVDRLRIGVQNLIAYCNKKTDTVKGYRSWQTGHSLEDWMEMLETFKSINVDYLDALINGSAITRDKATLLASWKYSLRTAKSELDKVNESIAETQKILASYKNDEVLISQQESNATKSTTAATEYYNKLVLQQAENYERAAELKATILDYEDRIQRLEAQQGTEVTEAVETELARAVTLAQELYQGIRSHIEELFTSQMYTTFEDHSAAQGKAENFLVASAKRMIIGGVVGVILACGMWFLAGLIPEFSKGRKEEENRKEVAAK